jgi:hypothetical protein
VTLDHSARSVILSSKGGFVMPQITLKETITRKLDIPLETLVKVIDSLSVAHRKKLLSRIERSAPSLQKFKKDKLTAIVTDFAKTDLYEKEFLTEMEAGLKKSSVYR